MPLLVTSVISPIAGVPMGTTFTLCTMIASDVSILKRCPTCRFFCFVVSASESRRGTSVPTRNIAFVVAGAWIGSTAAIGTICAMLTDGANAKIGKKYLNFIVKSPILQELARYHQNRSNSSYHYVVRCTTTLWRTAFSVGVTDLRIRRSPLFANLRIVPLSVPGADFNSPAPPRLRAAPAPQPPCPARGSVWPWLAGPRR